MTKRWRVLSIASRLPKSTKSIGAHTAEAWALPMGAWIDDIRLVASVFIEKLNEINNLFYQTISSTLNQLGLSQKWWRLLST